MSEVTVERAWDYTHHAKYYVYRPNYCDRAIDLMVQYVGARADTPDYLVLDVGAGTGNLTQMLLARGLRLVAVEPNDAMRALGIERTAGQAVQWVKAGGTETAQNSKSFDWVTFGSSFNVIDRETALREAHRVLKPGGYFSCMWNHRNLNDPIQQQCEAIVEALVPDYHRGVRREDQRPVIEQSGLFTDLFYLEVDFQVEQTVENYLSAWQSVRNKFWDVTTPEGARLLETLLQRMRVSLPARFPIQYTTRAWTARKRG